MSSNSVPRFTIGNLPRVRGNSLPRVSGERVLGERNAWARAVTTTGTTLTESDVVEHFSRSGSFAKGRTQQAVLRAYDSAASQLAIARSETERFVRCIIDSSIDLSTCKIGEEPKKKLHGFIRELLSDIYSATLSRPGSIKTLELLSQPPRTLSQALNEHHRSNIETFANELFQLQRHMLDRQLIGTIRYAGRRNRNCSFTYFQWKAFMTVKTRADRTLASPPGVPYWRQGEWWSRIQKTIETKLSGTMHIRHVSKTHLLSNSKAVPVDAWLLPLPPRVKAVVDAIPQFLRPYARIVHGVFEYGRSIERDVKSIPYEYCNTYQTTEEVRHYDPAVLIGGAVITGWCPTEQPKSGPAQRTAANVVHRLFAERG